MSKMLVFGLALVALNAFLANVPTDAVPPIAHAVISGTIASTSALLLYLRPVVPAGSLVLNQNVEQQQVTAQPVEETEEKKGA